MPMISNERGGIVSSVLIIPVGVVVIIVVFLLGYYVGKSRTAQDAAAERPQALPEITAPAAQDKDKEEFTFYKTLTEKGDKTLSIELKTKPRSEAPSPSSGTEQKTETGKTRTSGVEKQGAARQQEPKQQTAKASPPPQKREVPAAKQVPSKIRYTIQVGAYPERSLAEDEVRSIKKKGYAAFIVASMIPDKGTWFRVRIGSFSSKPSAEKLAAELKSKEGITSFITVE